MSAPARGRRAGHRVLRAHRRERPEEVDGDRGAPFQLFRHSEGNFHTAIGDSLERLTQGKENPAPEDPRMKNREIDVRGMIEGGRPPAADSLGAASR